eukprot:SAG31_NODE_1015_length_10366_cov_47.726113_6_plen_180_part_00
MVKRNIELNVQALRQVSLLSNSDVARSLSSRDTMFALLHSMMKMENADAVESTAPAAVSGALLPHDASEFFNSVPLQASVEAAPPAEPAQDDADADMVPISAECKVAVTTLPELLLYGCCTQDPDLAEAIRLSQQTFAVCFIFIFILFFMSHFVRTAVRYSCVDDDDVCRLKQRREMKS